MRDEHLSPVTLSALADAELSDEQMSAANERLAECSACSQQALATTLLKSATAKAGKRYEMPGEMPQWLAVVAAEEQARVQGLRVKSDRGQRQTGWSGRIASAVCAASLLVFGSVVVIQHVAQRVAIASVERAGLVAEVTDQHIAALADLSQLEVLSSDKHTVKPWFQGRLPFSFNLPDHLPTDVTLDGADLTYVHGQPAAQLLYHVGRHRVSVFVRANLGAAASTITAEHAGFRVDGFTTASLAVIAVSDVDPARLADLVARIEQAQGGN